MLEKLRALNCDRMDIDEAIELASFGKVASDFYVLYEVPVPEWLTSAMKTLDEDIKRRRRDALEARLKTLKARKSALRSRDEERAEIDKELERLQGVLGG